MSFCNISNQSLYPFILPELPYAKDSFMPYFTSETFDYHHGQHHKAYVNNLNNLLEAEKDLQTKNLEEIIILSSNSNQAIFNNAAQVWNHTFFFNSIIPGGTAMQGALLNQILSDFGSVENFTAEFKKNALAQFGSGWVWLVVKEGHIEIMKTANAQTPITLGLQPILACDVWEHAYYIDYRNRRLDYVTVFIEHMINWEFVGKNFQTSYNK